MMHESQYKVIQGEVILRKIIYVADIKTLSTDKYKTLKNGDKHVVNNFKHFLNSL